MGLRMRLTLLMLTAILSDNYPPAVPPGNGPGVPKNDVEVVRCPKCKKETDVESDGLYFCRCRGWFDPAESWET